MNIVQKLLSLDKTTPIGYRQNLVVTTSDFIDGIAAWHHYFLNQDKNSAVLYCNDRILFAQALLGAWCAEVKTILPTDLTAASRQFLQKGDPLFVDDKTEKQLATEPDVLPDLQLSFDKPLVELFTSGSTGTPTRIEKKHLSKFWLISKLWIETFLIGQKKVQPSAQRFPINTSTAFYGLFCGPWQRGNSLHQSVCCSPRTFCLH